MRPSLPSHSHQGCNSSSICCSRTRCSHRLEGWSHNGPGGGRGQRNAPGGGAAPSACTIWPQCLQTPATPLRLLVLAQVTTTSKIKLRGLESTESSRIPSQMTESDRLFTSTSNSFGRRPLKILRIFGAKEERKAHLNPCHLYLNSCINCNSTRLFTRGHPRLLDILFV